MAFTAEEIMSMQDPDSKIGDWSLSATHSALLWMENDGRIYEYIESMRRIDGTTTAAIVQTAFTKFKVTVDDWALGSPDFDVIARRYNEDREPVAIPDIIQGALKSALVTADELRLTRQLDPADYKKVNQVIEALGGKWSKRRQAHLFAEANAEEAVAEYLETGKIDTFEAVDFNYFPTPRSLADTLVKLSGIGPESLVLEPEAGTGGIALAAAAVVPRENIVCYEIQQKHCATLRELGFQAECVDFLKVAQTPVFDAVLMNPPFRKQLDIDHVLHALGFVKPGGTLTAIMSTGVTFRKNRKTLDFLRILEEYKGVIIENEAGSFKESGTMAGTVRIKMFKPQATAVDVANASTIVFESTTPPGAIPPTPVSAKPMPLAAPVAQAAFDF
jgi:predicted RNA methylase